MARLGLEAEVVDSGTLDRTVQRFRQAGVRLPTFAELASPWTLDPAVPAGLDPDAPDPRNLLRVHWYNAPDRRGLADVPASVELPSSLTGVDARIVVALGSRFPMIGAHKVLAAYACLVPRLVTGQFDPERHLAIWPSTGNYCRGGVAISRSLGCRGVAVLPEGMSAERFHWLEHWVTDPADIVRTPGTESNVKAIYDKCAELDADPANIVFNQFCEFGNHLAHYAVTGAALAHVFRDYDERAGGGLRLRGFVSATGSAGTIAAGDYLKEMEGSLTIAVEALECPTLLYNGFGEHNIQGIGDKHVPLIHNLMATDLAVAVSDLDTDGLFVLFQTEAGRAYLRDRRGLSETELDTLAQLGLSGICNVLAAIKTAKYLDLGRDDVLLTVATDSGAMYGSEVARLLEKRFAGQFDGISAAETFGRAVLGAGVDHLLELSHVDRTRLFNLGYYTWVEQQGVSVEAFEARRDPGWWRDLRRLLGQWDALIDDLNAAVAG